MRTRENLMAVQFGALGQVTRGSVLAKLLQLLLRHAM